MNLIQWRQLHKINQQTIAEGAGVSITSIIKYERNEELRSATREKIESYINKVDGGLFVSQKRDYTPKSMEIDTLWSYIPKEYSYIAKDKSGEVYLHRSEPSVKQDTWESNSCCRLPINILFEDEDWKKCCVKRPYNYWDYVGKIGVFTDKNNLNFQIIGELESIDLESESPFKRKNGFSYSNFRPLSELEKNNLA